MGAKHRQSENGSKVSSKKRRFPIVGGPLLRTEGLWRIHSKPDKKLVVLWAVLFYGTDAGTKPCEYSVVRKMTFENLFLVWSPFANVSSKFSVHWSSVFLFQEELDDSSMRRT